VRIFSSVVPQAVAKGSISARWACQTRISSALTTNRGRPPASIAVQLRHYITIGGGAFKVELREAMTYCRRDGRCGARPRSR
jgi:hypothetical protein